MKNPLLSIQHLPSFDEIKPEHITPALDVLLEDAEKAFSAVTALDFPGEWHAISKQLGVAVERMSVAWGACGHLKSVMDTPEFRSAYNENLPRVMAFYIRLGSDERLYSKYKTIKSESLNAEQKVALEHALRDFVLDGAELAEGDKSAFLAIQEKIAMLQQKFSENVLDATDGFIYYANEQEMEGVPIDVKRTAKNQATKEGKEDYKLTLQMPCYLPVMQFAKSSELRRKLYKAYVTRASDVFESSDEKAKERDNTNIIKELLELRAKEAELLGFPNFGELSLATKMAESCDEVVKFLRELNQKARPFALQDAASLRAFAAQELGIEQPNPWDWTFIGERQKEKLFNYSEQEVKQYFPLPKVLEGLFSLVASLFDIRICEDTAAIWHSSVKFFRIEKRGKNGVFAPVSYFYLDSAARSGKRGGAWMDDVRSRWIRPDTGEIQLPVAQLVCNFASDVDGRPALLQHDDVITLFHEFGHGLHHMLTEVGEISVSGINGVEWDAVELPSQFMENFCWEYDVIKKISSHMDSKEPLPKSLFNKMMAAKNYQSGMQTVRQIEFSLFDMLLHTQLPIGGDFLQVVKDVKDEVAVLDSPDWARTPHSFSHIFAGGYGAGYYSYKWAEVLSADVYAAFEESKNPDGSHNVEVGVRYLNSILQRGSTRPIMESFKEFRKRGPSIDALLRHQGMIEEH